MDFSNMELMLKVFWVVAILASLVFLVQTIMTFTGTDASDGLSADFDGSLDGGDAPFQLFSLRNLTNFLLGFGWMGVTGYQSFSNKSLLVAAAAAVGIVFVLLFFIIIRQVQKLAEDNSFNIQKVLGKTGEVYLSIPAQNMGKGKVQISVNGSVHELDAITQGEKIDTGAMVKVTDIMGDNLLVVTKL